MKSSILKRIEAIEQHTKNTAVPDLIMIYYMDNINSWVVDETYKRGASDYKTITKTVDDPSAYIVPEGFNGVCIWDDLSGPPCDIEYDDWAKAQRVDDERAGTRFVHCCYV